MSGEEFKAVQFIIILQQTEVSLVAVSSLLHGAETTRGDSGITEIVLVSITARGKKKTTTHLIRQTETLPTDGYGMSCARGGKCGRGVHS